MLHNASTAPKLTIHLSMGVINSGTLLSADKDMQLGRIFEDRCAEMYYRVCIPSCPAIVRSVDHSIAHYCWAVPFS